MRVHRVQESSAHEATVELLDDDGQPIPAVASFLRYLRTRGCSPNTLSAYAYDLLHFMLFLKEQQLTYQEFTPPHAFQFLEYLSTIPSRKQARRLGLVLSTTTTGGTSATRLSPATINRTFAAVSSFYEYLILSGAFTGRENPLQQQVDDQALARVAERHRPFMGRASRQRPIRRSVHVKTVRRVPRPMDDEQIGKLLTSLSLKRDKAMLLLMLHGGLRPGDYIGCFFDVKPFFLKKCSFSGLESHYPIVMCTIRRKKASLTNQYHDTTL